MPEPSQGLTSYCAAARAPRPHRGADTLAQTLQQHHYLGCPACGAGPLVRGHSREEWVALLGWAAAALKCRPRDAWIGWTPPLQWRRLPFVVNNVRFCLLPPGPAPTSLPRAGAHCAASVPTGAGLRPSRAARRDLRGRGPLPGHLLPRGGLAVSRHDPGFAKRNTGYVAHGHPRPCGCAAAAARRGGPDRPVPPTLSPAGRGGLRDARCQWSAAGRRRWPPGPVADRPRSAAPGAGCATLSGRSWPRDLRVRWPGLGASRPLRVARGLSPPPCAPGRDRRTPRRTDHPPRLAVGGRGCPGRAARPVAAPGGGPTRARLSVDGKTLRGGHARGQPAPHCSARSSTRTPWWWPRRRARGHQRDPRVPPPARAPPAAGAVVTADASAHQTETARFLVEAKQADYVFRFFFKDKPARPPRRHRRPPADAFPPRPHH